MDEHLDHNSAVQPPWRPFHLISALSVVKTSTISRLDPDVPDVIPFSFDSIEVPGGWRTLHPNLGMQYESVGNKFVLMAFFLAVAPTLDVWCHVTLNKFFRMSFGTKKITLTRAKNKNCSS